MASCPTETTRYRQCLKDARNSGGGSCLRDAKALEACREKWRIENQVVHQFDGRRILPNAKCQSINHELQKCLQWKGGDQSKCQDIVQRLDLCMKRQEGILAAPTQGDKVWADYKGTK